MPGPNLVYQELQLRDSSNRLVKYGCVVDRNATILDFLNIIASKYGLQIDKKYYEKYGSYLVTSISGTDRDGNRFELADIQMYVDGKFVHLRAEDGTNGWANAELLRVGDLQGKSIVFQSDTALGNDFLSQDLKAVPVVAKADELLYRDNSWKNRNNSGGGASEPSMDTDRKEIESLKTQSTAKILVEVSDNSFKATTLDGEEINDSNFFRLMNQEFGISLPQLTPQAEGTLRQYFDRAIKDAIAGQEFDGRSYSVELELKLVSTRFDAIERYQLYIYPPDSYSDNPQMQNSGRFSFELQETQMELGQANKEMERFVGALERAGIGKKEDFVPNNNVGMDDRETTRTERVTPAKEYVPEESMIVRLIMNPTERRLWGRLYGFPDEEVAQMPNENSQLAKMPSFSKQAEPESRIAQTAISKSETKTEKSEMDAKPPKRRKKKERAAEEKKEGIPPVAEKILTKKPALELPKEISKGKTKPDEKDSDAGKGEKAGKRREKQNARKEMEPKKEEKRAQRLEELKKKLELAKERKEEAQKKAEKSEKEKEDVAKSKKDAKTEKEAKLEKAKTNLINLDDKKNELEKKAKDKQKPDAPKLAEKKDYGVKKAVATSAKGNENEARKITEKKAKEAKANGGKEVRAKQSEITKPETKKSANVPKSKKPEEKKAHESKKAKEPARTEAAAQIYSPFQENRKQKTVSPFAIWRSVKPKKSGKMRKAA